VGNGAGSWGKELLLTPYYQHPRVYAYRTMVLYSIGQIILVVDLFSVLSPVPEIATAAEKIAAIVL
jgi:hypothetical protein